MKKTWKKNGFSFLRDTAGATALVFALSVPMFIGASGIAVDLAQAYNVKNRLGNALDKAALAAGSMTGDTDDIEEGVHKFIEANYPDIKLGTTFDVDVEFGDGTVTVSASARVNTSFMNILGQEYLDVHESTTVRRELAGVEVALVLDVTGSMAGNNIAALKTASHNFIDIMFERISDLEYLKVGIVPFSQSVNVGNGLAAGFVSYPASDPYKSPPTTITYSSGTSGTTTNWRGCIRERASPLDTTDDTTPNWGMYRYPKVSGNTNPNNNCTNSRIVPLTNNRTTLDTAITNLQTGGNTYGNVGMVWGWRVLSPTAPFTEGVSYDDPDWTKTVVMMTDGDNTVNNAYSAYGANPGIDADDLDDKFAAVCENMKDEGIKIYTITFQSGISNATREIFRQCASDPTKYFNAPSNEDLTEAFQQIANELSQLHIVH